MNFLLHGKIKKADELIRPLSLYYRNRIESFTDSTFSFNKPFDIIQQIMQRDPTRPVSYLRRDHSAHKPAFRPRIWNAIHLRLQPVFPP